MPKWKKDLFVRVIEKRHLETGYDYEVIIDSYEKLTIEEKKELLDFFLSKK